MTLATLSPEEAARRIRACNALLVDIREADERARQSIPGSVSSPLSTIGQSPLPLRPGQAVIFHCLSGARTAQNAPALERLATGHEAFILEGGLRAWQASAQPVETHRGAPLPLMRQVQIAAGSIVLLGALGGALWHPALHVVSALAGAGLVMAGLTGACPMASLLARMPWNRRPA